MNVQNNRMNGNMNGNGAVGSMPREQLFRKIQALAFAKTEAELYLDVYPECATALAYYKDTVEALKNLTEIYENRFGPITAAGTRGEAWSWIDGAWPWHYGEREEER